MVIDANWVHLNGHANMVQEGANVSFGDEKLTPMGMGTHIGLRFGWSKAHPKGHANVVIDANRAQLLIAEKTTRCGHPCPLGSAFRGKLDFNFR